jgi:BMFP domain-containing protein YqiC|tara:strand:- start:67 stop:345 length:279 start_codon:yes stop_codon:yes gene_type:complete
MIKSKFLSDFSNIAQGAFSTVNAIKEELDVMVRSRIERVLTSKGLVTKEENDVIIARINLLDKKIDGLEAMISKQVEELKKIKEKNKSAKGK